MKHERRQIIVDKIQKEETLRVSDLVRDFQVSIETIRRDLEFLEQEGHLQRVYGGAVLHRNFSVTETGHAEREETNRPQKEAIGEMAAALVNNGDSLYIDNGTTTRELARHLAGKKNLTVLTNSALIALDLAKTTGADCKIILLGGEIRRGELAVSGAMTDSNLRNFYIAKAFIGIGGINLETGLTDYHIQEAGTRRIVIERAGTVIALADNSKFGKTALNFICPADILDILVTDYDVPEPVLNEYRALGITVYAAQKRTGIYPKESV